MRSCGGGAETAKVLVGEAEGEVEAVLERERLPAGLGGTAAGGGLGGDSEAGAEGRPGEATWSRYCRAKEKVVLADGGVGGAAAGTGEVVVVAEGEQRNRVGMNRERSPAHWTVLGVVQRMRSWERGREESRAKLGIKASMA